MSTQSVNNNNQALGPPAGDKQGQDAFIIVLTAVSALMDQLKQYVDKHGQSLYTTCALMSELATNPKSYQGVDSLFETFMNDPNMPAAENFLDILYRTYSPQIGQSSSDQNQAMATVNAMATGFESQLKGVLRNIKSLYEFVDDELKTITSGIPQG